MDRFVVGTGRCGSTLLSRMLSEHEDVLSVFEFMNGLDMGRRFAERLTGPELAELLAAEQPFVTAVLRRGYRVEEIVYPFGEPGMRYGPSDPLPWLCVAMLPRLSPRPDALFDDAVAWAAERSEAAPADHYRAFFEWLGERLGRPLWIERSGSSIDYLGDLAQQFPQARFLHIHRDGREVALSMREHHAYRLPIGLLYDVSVESGRHVSELGPFDVHAPPTGDDVVSQILAARPPPFYFGRYWTDQVRRGHAARLRLDAGHYREIRFEDLLGDPVPVLRSVAEFFELGDAGGWIERAAKLVRGAPAARFEALPADARGPLEAACAPGLELLGR